VNYSSLTHPTLTMLLRIGFFLPGLLCCFSMERDRRSDDRELKPNGKDLQLPEPRRVIRLRAESVLTHEEAPLIQRAKAGAIPCPTCGQPLNADLIVSEQVSGVLLYCRDVERCGYREF
jgi:hypothetical protein